MNPHLKTIPIEPAFFSDRSTTRLAWLGMAGALINARGSILLIDPLISTVEEGGEVVSEEGFRLKVPLPIEAKDVPSAGWVLYTHGDNDHFGRETARILAQNLPSCRFLAPPPVARGLLDLGVDPARVVTAVEGSRHPVGEAEIEVTPALHDWQEVDPWRREDCCGYLVRSPDGAVWHPGDTRLIDDLYRYQDVDVLFFDVAAVDTHLGPAGSAALAKSCGAKVLLAYHYGTLDLPPGSFGGCDPDDALPYLEGMPGRYLKPNPGEVISFPV